MVAVAADHRAAFSERVVEEQGVSDYSAALAATAFFEAALLLIRCRWVCVSLNVGSNDNAGKEDDLPLKGMPTTC